MRAIFNASATIVVSHDPHYISSVPLLQRNRCRYTSFAACAFEESFYGSLEWAELRHGPSTLAGHTKSGATIIQKSLIPSQSF